MNKKRLSIALFICEVEGDYHEVIMKGINDALKKFDVNLLVIVGKPLYSPESYENNHNILYKIFNDGIDGIIMASGSLAKYADKSQMYKFYESINSSIPTVSLSLPYKSSCCIDNKVGFKKLVEHIIKVHNKRKIAFISGPLQHSESIERFNVFTETLKENDILFENELFIPGLFTIESAIKGVREFLKKGIKFDSIICSNDEMAIGAIKVLTENNFKVPEQISVTGFDNIQSSLLNNLTTINQPMYDLGYKSAELIMDLISTRKSYSIVLDTQLIIRESCGCKFKNIENVKIEESSIYSTYNYIIHEYMLKTTELLSAEYQILFREFIQSILESSIKNKVNTNIYKLYSDILDSLNEDECFLLHNIVQNIKVKFLNINEKIVENCFYNISNVYLDKLSQKSALKNRNVLEAINILRQVLISILISADDLQNKEYYFTEKLKEIGIINYYVFVYENSFIFTNFEDDNCYNKLYLNLKLSNEKQSNSCIRIHEVISNIFKERRKTIIVFPLFFHNEQLGLIVYEHDDTIYDISVYETLAVYFSCSIKVANTLNSRKKIENTLKLALNELESYNEKLNYLSYTDELTGLYNRRGFNYYSEKLIQLNSGKNLIGYIFYADMDGLKKINDNHGHEEGDLAIQCMAEILKQTFRKNDILARLGGDEFTIISVSDNYFSSDIIYSRLESVLLKFNKKKNKQYSISISMGVVQFKIDDRSISIDNLLTRADKSLYENKKKKYFNK